MTVRPMQQIPFGADMPGAMFADGAAPAGTAVNGATGTQPRSSSGSVAGVREQCGALLMRTHDWLERAVAQAPDVNGLVPLVTQAVGFYSRGEYIRCLRLASGVQQAIALARAAMPSLPAW
jgi:hypothetical protein